MPEHRMIDVPEVDFMDVTENVTDWRIGKRVEIRRPRLSLSLGCGALLAVPIAIMVIVGMFMGNLESFYAPILWMVFLGGGAFALIVIPFSWSNRSRRTVIDWSDETVRFDHGMRGQTFSFSDVERVCLQTTKSSGEPPEYRGTVDVEVAGRQFPVFELLTSNEDQDKPTNTLLAVARRLADVWAVPCEVYVLGKRFADEDLAGRGRSPEEIAKKYMSLGSMASGHAMSADYHGNADEAAEYRQEAIFYYMQANTIDPTLTEPLLAIGRLSPNGAHRERAVDAALQLDPDSVPALIERGRHLVMNGREEEGFAALTKAVEKDPSRTTYHARGNSYQFLDRYPEAHADFTAAIELDPEDADCYNARGECLKAWYDDSPSQDLLPRALADFDEAIRLDGEDTSYRVERARVLLAADRFDDAIAEFSRVITAEPDSFYGYSQRGQAYLDTGHYAREAEQDFSRAVELLEKQPRTTDSVMQGAQLRSIAFAYRLRAEARRQLGRLEQADADDLRAAELEDEVY